MSDFEVFFVRFLAYAVSSVVCFLVYYFIISKFFPHGGNHA